MVIEAFSSFSKKPNSTKQPTTGRQITVRLKEPTSVLNPTFLVNNFSLSDNYIKWGSRYYYIRDINIVTNDLAEYVCETDVMATYKSYIGNSSQYIARSASAFNNYVTDSFYPMTTDKAFSFESGNRQANGFIFPEGGTFVFGIQGQPSNDTFGCTKYYILDIYQAASLMDEIFNIQNSEYDAQTIESVYNIPEGIYQSIINPQQYIVSCMYLPFDPETIGGATTEPIMLGWYDIGVSARVFNPSFETLPYTEHTFTIPKHPQASRGKYLNNEPFSCYKLMYMPFGDIELPADKMIEATNIYCKVICDVITGQATLKVYLGTGDQGYLLTSSVAKLGVDVAVSSGVYESNPLKMFGNVGTGLVSKAIPLITGQIGLEQAFNGVVNSFFKPEVSTSGSNGGLDFLEYDTILYAVFTKITAEDNPQHGRPLCETRTISTLSGYVQCVLPDLDMPATPEEKDTILSYMANGFYYE